MGLIKKPFIIILALLVLSSPVLANLCLTIETSAKRTCQNSYLDEANHSHQEDSACNNKSPCSDKYTCCNLVNRGAISYLFILDSYYLNAAEILISPLEITKRFYRPPRINLF
jgi:hypothetical protein